MFAFADPQRVSRILTASGWAQPRLERVELKLDIAAGSGLEEAVGQSIRVGAASSALRNQPSERVSAAVASIRGRWPHIAMGRVYGFRRLCGRSAARLNDCAQPD